MIDSVEQSASFYLDANAVIYFLEKVQPYNAVVAQIFGLAARTGARILTSDMAVAECLHGVFAARRADLRDVYARFFESSQITVLPVDSALLIAAAEIGGTRGLKLIDAAHVAAAERNACDVFVTNDRRIRSIANGRVLQIGPARP